VTEIVLDRAGVVTITGYAFGHFQGKFFNDFSRARAHMSHNKSKRCRLGEFVVITHIWCFCQSVAPAFFSAAGWYRAPVMP
jgi:hypothetical protein